MDPGIHLPSQDANTLRKKEGQRTTPVCGLLTTERNHDQGLDSVATNRGISRPTIQHRYLH